MLADCSFRVIIIIYQIFNTNIVQWIIPPKAIQFNYELYSDKLKYFCQMRLKCAKTHFEISYKNFFLLQNFIKKIREYLQDIDLLLVHVTNFIELNWDISLEKKVIYAKNRLETRRRAVEDVV